MGTPGNNHSQIFLDRSCNAALERTLGSCRAAATTQIAFGPALSTPRANECPKWRLAQRADSVQDRRDKLTGYDYTRLMTSNLRWRLKIDCSKCKKLSSSTTRYTEAVGGRYIRLLAFSTWQLSSTSIYFICYCDYSSKRPDQHRAKIINAKSTGKAAFCRTSSQWLGTAATPPPHSFNITCSVKYCIGDHGCTAVFTWS